MISRLRAKKALKRLMAEWMEFQARVASRFGAPDVGFGEADYYLALQGRITQSLTKTMSAYKVSAGQEAGLHERQMTELLNKYCNLQASRPMTQMEREGFEREWHRHYLFLNKLAGLSPKREPKVPPRPFGAAPAPRARRLVWRRSNRSAGFLSRLVTLLVVLFILVLVIPWGRLGFEGVAPDPNAGGVRGALGEVREGIARGLAVLHVPSLKTIFEPVIAQWGLIPTVVMILVLFIALGTWFFIRKA